jgi:hypothetical protein
LAQKAWQEGWFGARRRVRGIPSADFGALARRRSSPQKASRRGRIAREKARWKFTDSIGLMFFFVFLFLAIENDLKELPELLKLSYGRNTRPCGT